MTDEESHKEYEPEPHMKLKDGKLWRRDENDEWEEIKPKKTGDPELDALWAMTISEVDEISEDDSHPWQEKAKQVKSESLEAWRVMADNMWQSLRPKFDFVLPWPKDFSRFVSGWANVGAPFEELGRSRLDEDLEAPDEDVAPLKPNDDPEDGEEEGPDDSTSTEFIESVPDAPLAMGTTVQGSPNLTEEPTMAQMVVIWKEMLEEMRRSNEHWEKSIKNAKDTGERAHKLAKEANRLANSANETGRSKLVISVIATLVSVASAVVAVIAAVS